jgi:hypothetical protein
MIPRLTFFAIAAFWVAMNVLLWRAEYDSHGPGVRVPTALVWQKILTAPDRSSLNIFQNSQRTGFCEFFTGVEQEMANLDESKVPPAGIASRKGYQVRLNGNVSLGDFADRLTFSSQMEFSREREWQELNLKLSSRFAVIEIHALAAEQNVHLKIISDGMTNVEVFSFADLQNPDAWWRVFNGNSGGDWIPGLDLRFGAPTNPNVLARQIRWEAHRDRLIVNREPVPAYRLEARIFDRPVVIYVSTLGEILRVDLPGGVVALLDQLGKP